MLFRRCTYFSHLPLLLSFHCPQEEQESGLMKQIRRSEQIPHPARTLCPNDIHWRTSLQGWEMATTTGLEQGSACEEGSRNFIQKTPLFSILLLSFYCGKMCTTWHWPFSPHLSVQVSGRTHMHTVVQPSPSCISGAFHHLKQKLHSHWTTTPIHSSLQPWSLLFSFLSLWMWLL